MTPYTYYEYYAWYMKPDGGFDSNNRVGYLSYGKQSPYTLNANAAWHVDPGGNVTVDFDFVSYSYGIIMVGFWIEIIIFFVQKILVVKIAEHVLPRRRQRLESVV